MPAEAALSRVAVIVVEFVNARRNVSDATFSVEPRLLNTDFAVLTAVTVAVFVVPAPVTEIVPY